MDDVNFTGPRWLRDGISVRTYAPAGEPRKRVCIMCPDVAVSSTASMKRMVAGAHLTAAAPSLYEALIQAANFIQPFNRAEDLLDQIDAAIALARGGAGATEMSEALGWVHAR